ncbi:Tannase/feruloyl esterase [Rhypophila sp. PSN 637]
MAPFLALLLNLWLASSAFAGPTIKLARQAGACDNTTLSTVLPSGTYIERLNDLPNGNATYGDPFPNLGYANATSIPAVCALTVRVTGPENSDYRFGLFLPREQTWTRNFLAVGNYGQAGGINWADMGPGLKYGMATVSTDTGHSSPGNVLNWALERNRGALPDWGYRAVNGSIHVAKALTTRYYALAGSNKTLDKSYWSGCSTGGRQGLKQIQTEPESLDGVLIGAPAWDTKRLFPWIAKIASYFSPIGGPTYLDVFQLLFVTQYIRGVCDPQDSPTGIADGVVSWPEECNFNLNGIRCNSTGQTNCITDAQIQTVLNLHADYVINGTVIFPGAPPGAEVTNPYILDPSSITNFSLEYFRYFLYPDEANSPLWSNFSHFLDNEAAIVGHSIEANPGQATADNFDLSAFRNRGGKIIMYHGTEDSTVPTGSTARFYSSVLTTTAGGSSATMDSFFRLFYVPGMGHCFPDAGTEQYVPWDIGGAGQPVLTAPLASVPGHFLDPQYDALAALLAWVNTTGTPSERNPQNITAVTWNATTLAEKSRPLCAFPRRAVYNTTRAGPIDQATSWDCVTV